MDFLRKKRDEITVYPDNSVWRNGAPEGNLTIEILGIPEERSGKEGTTQTYYYRGIIVHAWVNKRQFCESAFRVRQYRQKLKKLRLQYRNTYSH